jgi:hypothetical protein
MVVQRNRGLDDQFWRKRLLHGSAIGEFPKGDTWSLFQDGSKIKGILKETQQYEKNILFAF